MSHEKAMRHTRNIRKVKKQSRMHFGFDTGTGHFRTNPLTRHFQAQALEVRRWFADRHNGDHQYVRDCIRESVAKLRIIKARIAAGETHSQA